jgi:hypothetical protein
MRFSTFISLSIAGLALAVPSEGRDGFAKRVEENQDAPQYTTDCDFRAYGTISGSALNFCLGGYKNGTPHFYESILCLT